MVNGQFAEKGTPTFHSNGQPSAGFSIDNDDPASQCFILDALAGSF